MITLDEQTHTYYIDGKKADYSVTQFISQFHSDFDADSVLDNIGITNEVLRAEMKRQWANSAPEGTFVHRVLELYVKGELDIESIYSAGYAKIPPKIQAGIQAIKDIKDSLKGHWEWHAEEMMSFTTTDGKNVAGTMDLLLVNQKDKELIVIDYKTSKSITKNAYGKKMKKPIEKTPESKFHKYSLQLEIYAYMAKMKYPGFNVKHRMLLQLMETGEYMLLPTKDMS